MKLFAIIEDFLHSCLQECAHPGFFLISAGAATWLLLVLLSAHWQGIY